MASVPTELESSVGEKIREVKKATRKRGEAGEGAVAWADGGGVVDVEEAQVEEENHVTNDVEDFQGLQSSLRDAVVARVVGFGCGRDEVPWS